MKSNIKEFPLDGLRTIISCRVSSESQAEGTSLDEQEAINLNYAKRHNMRVVSIFREEASAMQPGKREKFNQIVKYLEDDEADAVIFTYVDRMSRNAVDAHKIFELVEKKKKVVIFVNENIVLKAPLLSHDLLVLDVLLGVSNYRVRQDREKCLAGIKARAMSGIRPNKPPYGYVPSASKRGVIVNKKRADFVKKAFELYGSGDFSVSEVIEELYGLGYRYDLQESKMIPKQSLFSMLKNVFYTGKYYVKQADEYVDGIHEPLVSVELFEKVQKMLEISPRSAKKHKVLYAHMLECENCGKIMCADVKEKQCGKTYVYYRCINKRCVNNLKISETQLDLDVEKYLKEVRLNLVPDEIVKKVLQDELCILTQKLTYLKQEKNRKYHEKIRFDEYVKENDIVDEIYIKGQQAQLDRKYGDIDSEIYFIEKQISMIREKCKNVFKKRLYDIFAESKKEDKQEILKLISNIFKCTSKGLKMTFKPAFRAIRQR